MPVYREDTQPDNELHRILLRAVPTNRFGNKSIATLAELIPCRRSAVNKWIKGGKLTPDKALRIVEIGKIREPGEPTGFPGRVRIEELHPFVYKPLTEA